MKLIQTINKFISKRRNDIILGIQLKSGEIDQIELKSGQSNARKISTMAKIILSISGIIMIFFGFFIILSQYGMKGPKIDIPITDLGWILLIGFLLIVFGFLLTSYAIFSDYDPEEIARMEMIEAEKHRNEKLSSSEKKSKDTEKEKENTQQCGNCEAINPGDAIICSICLHPIITRDLLNDQRMSAKAWEEKRYATKENLKIYTSIFFFAILVANIYCMSILVLYYNNIFGDYQIPSSVLISILRILCILSFLFWALWVFISKPKHCWSFPAFFACIAVAVVEFSIIPL